MWVSENILYLIETLCTAFLWCIVFSTTYVLNGQHCKTSANAFIHGITHIYS